MSPQFRAIAAALWLAGMVTAVTAQQTGPKPAANAASSAPAGYAPPARAGGYRSAFEGYKAFNEQPVLSWRESNSVVGRIGGWQAYAREGQGGPTATGGDTPAASPDKTAAPAMPAAHGGMKMADPMSPAKAPMNAPMTMPMPAPKAKPAAAPASAAAPSGHTGHQKP